MLSFVIIYCSIRQLFSSGYRRTAADIHEGYLDMPSTPLFTFGHGLSYTSFDFGPLVLESDTVDVSGEARPSLTVTNTGSRGGTEVVQLYAADTATGVTLPAQQLVGFARVDLDVSAGSSSNDIRSSATFTVTGKTRSIRGDERAFLSIATVGS
jgi:beta-xylosidase